MALFERTYNISLARPDDNSISIYVQLLDSLHDLRLNILLGVQPLAITGAHLEVVKIPRPQCEGIKELASNLVGLEIGKGLSKKLRQLLGGPSGCSNLLNMALISLPLAANAQYMHDPNKTGYIMTPEEYNRMREQVMRGHCLGWPDDDEAGVEEKERTGGIKE